MLSWQYAAAAAVGLAIVAVTARAVRRRRPGGAWSTWGGVAQEAALLFGLYALWQFAGSFTVLSRVGAMSRARWLWHAERVLRLPSETSVQRLFLPHPLLVQAFNLYYDTLHFAALGACLIWLYLRHRDSYPAIRTTVALFTGASLLIQLIPVAPPRLLPVTGPGGTGLIDTAVRYGQSVYSWHGGFNADEFSAMPSVHVGWALIVAVAVITASRSRWRWLAAGYPILTTLVVVVTANHFWLDGIVAGLLVALVMAVQALARRLRPDRDRVPGPAEDVRGEMSVRR